jgi:MbtH protein
MVFDDETATFIVLLNHEEQFSIWPLGWEIPSGWRQAGFSGLKPECLAHIEEVWTDIRPLGLRVALGLGNQH